MKNPLVRVDREISQGVFPGVPWFMCPLAMVAHRSQPAAATAPAKRADVKVQLGPSRVPCD